MRRAANPAERVVLRDVLVAHADPQRALLPELVALLNGDDDRPIAQLLADFAGADAIRREAVTDLIGISARALAPDDVAPHACDSAAVWKSLVSAADALHGSGACALGRLPFVTERLLAQLRDESRREAGDLAVEDSRATAGAGDTLAALAVSRQLTSAVSAAVGAPVVPTYDALYEFDPPGSRVATHLDSRGYEIVFHLLVEQPSRDGVDGASTLVAHVPSSPAPERVQLRVGEALVLRGRGTIHAWEPLPSDERRTLIAIGFETARDVARQ